MGEDIGVSRQPTGAVFDVVLLLHIACVIVGLATTLTGVATASRLRRLAQRAVPLPKSMGRYFAPGVNWAGRAVYGIPVFGLALIAMSRGAYALGDGWVVSGLGIFVVLALVAEGILWPTERRLQHTLVEPLADGASPGPSVLGDTTTMARSAAACTVLLVLGSALMIAQP
jgi:uncharacterized membrane protein